MTSRALGEEGVSGRDVRVRFIDFELAGAHYRGYDLFKLFRTNVPNCRIAAARPPTPSRPARHHPAPHAFSPHAGAGRHVSRRAARLSALLRAPPRAAGQRRARRARRRSGDGARAGRAAGAFTRPLPAPPPPSPRRPPHRRHPLVAAVAPPHWVLAPLPPPPRPTAPRLATHNAGRDLRGRAADVA